MFHPQLHGCDRVDRLGATGKAGMGMGIPIFSAIDHCVVCYSSINSHVPRYFYMLARLQLIQYAQRVCWTLSCFLLARHDLVQMLECQGQQGCRQGRGQFLRFILSNNIGVHCSLRGDYPYPYTLVSVKLTAL